MRVRAQSQCQANKHTQSIVVVGGNVPIHQERNLSFSGNARVLSLPSWSRKTFAHNTISQREKKGKKKSKKNVKFCSYRVWFSSVNYDVVDAVLVLLGNGDGEAGVVVALRGRKQRLPDRLHGALIARAHYNHVHTHTFQVRKKKTKSNRIQSSFTSL
jgi:hypothetical protein